MQVEHRKRYAGEDHLVVVQPDGTLALIPSWMSEETAALCDPQRTPSAACRKAGRAARSESMRFSPLEAGYGPRVKEAIMQPRHRLQRDLFEKDHRTPEYSDVAEGHSRPPDPGPPGRGHLRRQQRDARGKRPRRRRSLMSKITPEHLARQAYRLCPSVDIGSGHQQSRESAAPVWSDRSGATARLERGRRHR